MVVERSEGDLEFLSNWVLADKDTPPVDPEKPPVDPEKPRGLENLPTELPDPNTPGAPDTSTILEDGVPVTYIKVWDPGIEEWAYVPDENIPLHQPDIPAPYPNVPVQPVNLPAKPADIPETGDHGVFPWTLLNLLSFFGLAAMLFRDRRKKR